MLLPTARDGKKLRLDATLEQVYDLGGQLGEGGAPACFLAVLSGAADGARSGPLLTTHPILSLASASAPTPLLPWPTHPPPRQATLASSWPRTARRASSGPARCGTGGGSPACACRLQRTAVAKAAAPLPVAGTAGRCWLFGGRCAALFKGGAAAARAPTRCSVRSAPATLHAPLPHAGHPAAQAGQAHE